MKRILLSFVIIVFFFSFVHAQQVSNSVRSLLSTEGRIMYDEEPNALVVTDYPENLKRIAEYLEVVDIAPQQVLIEAKVVEVRLGKEHSLGVNWQMFAAKEGLEIGQFKVSSALGGGPLEQQIPYKSTYYPPGQVADGAENPFTFTIFDDNLNIVLSALANDLETNILSAPSVTTVNNREAQIRIVQRVPWAEPEVDMTEFGVSVTWTIHFEDVGITLKVTPTINEDGKITMNLLPEISEQVDSMNLQVVSGTGSNTQNVTYSVPVIDKRSASTKVVVGTGQTLIIGGLIKNKTTKGHTKIPFFGDVPVLGHLFKSSRDTLEKIELLIFVSPTIINANEVARMVRQERFGMGKQSYLDRQRQDKMALIMEIQEREKMNQLVLDWEMLSRKNAELSEQTKKLEQMLLLEEKGIQDLEIAKQTAIERRQALTK